MAQKGSYNIIFSIIGLIVIFIAGIFVGKASVVCPYCTPEDVDFSLMWEVWAQLENNYVNPGDINAQELVYGAIAGMVEAVGDPFTIFFNPEETTTFLEDVGGQFEGVGMEIGVRDGQLQVISPIEGTPAEKAGLRAGDKIVKIGDVSSLDIKSEEAVALIRGPKGTEVTLTIFRDGWDTTQEFIIKRAVIKIPSMKWELKEGNIAYIQLYQFSEKSDQDFQKIALEILDSSATKIVLDLRNNPGGYLERAQDIAGWFLERGQIVVIEDFGNGQNEEIYKALGNSKLATYPIVILINQGSASASEILAAALKDNRGVTLIGETSYGKGCVQKLINLTDNSSLKVTVANWLTPNRNLIHNKGLDPDIKVEFTEEDYKQDIDPQLDKALEIIRQID
jgi:carboxyl-terminal processing protease